MILANAGLSVRAANVLHFVGVTVFQGNSPIVPSPTLRRMVWEHLLDDANRLGLFPSWGSSDKHKVWHLLACQPHCGVRTRREIFQWLRRAPPEKNPKHTCVCRQCGKSMA